MFGDSHDFDMLAVDVVLGDDTRCTLDFAESPYLCRLHSMESPVSLSFGSAAAVRELKAIVSLRQSTTLSRLRGANTDVCSDERKGAMGSRTLARTTTTTTTASTSTPTSTTPAAAAVHVGAVVPTAMGSTEELAAGKEGSPLCLQMRQLSEKRKLFMEVLELTARLEMEETFPLLCAEFGRIYNKEVKDSSTIELLTLWERTSARLQGLDAYRLRVINAFALDADATAVISHEQRKHWLSDSDEVEHQCGRKTSPGSHGWQKWLKEDRYFFPEANQLGDLTQSVDTGVLAAHNRSCFDEEFATDIPRHPFQNPTWEADDVATACPVCDKDFATWSTLSLRSVRASHCRCCGRRLCAKCTSWQLDRSIAKLSKPGGPEEGRLRRVCRSCFERAQKLNEHAFLCEIFVHAGLALTDIALLRSINAQWRGAAELCLSDYRSSLYQNTSWNSVVTPQTTRILASSVDTIAGHPEPLIFLFISLDWSDKKLLAAAYEALEITVEGAERQWKMRHPGAFFWRPRVSHWHMLCTRACGLMLPPFFAIKLLECLHRAPAGNATAEKMRMMVTQAFLLGMVSSLDSRVSECLIPLLLDVFDLKTCQPYATSVLLELAKLEQRLALVICQETVMRCEHDDLSYQTLRELVVRADLAVRPKRHQWFLNTLRFLNLLTNAWKTPKGQPDITEARAAFQKQLCDEGLITPVSDMEDASGTLLTSPMLFPFDTNVVVTHINVNGIIAMNSRQRPVVIPLIDAHGVTRRILYKKENLEKDKVMCITSRFLQWVLQRQLRHVVLPTYHVMPLSPSSGIIEIVEEGQTVQHVIEQYKEHRLLQHLVQLEQQQQQKEQLDLQRHTHKTEGWPTAGIRENFLCSAKFFILMNYIFAIGDRHRDNVMIHPSGAIFHIDFGMLLTTRTLAERVTTSYVRFDLDLEECVLQFMRDKASATEIPLPAPPPPPPQQQQQQKQKQQQPQRKQSKSPLSTPTTLTAVSGDTLLEFLMETAGWFLEVRPYAGILYQLLSHVVYRRALDGVPSVDDLTVLMHTIFMRDAAEETCKTLFCDRVKKSRGQTWLKDFTHDTQKRTWSMVSQGYNWVREKTGLRRSNRRYPCDEGSCAASRLSSNEQYQLQHQQRHEEEEEEEREGENNQLP